MMLRMATYFVGVYWGSRAESRDACGARLTSLLHTLKTHDSGLSQWFRKTSDRSSPKVALSSELEEVSSSLKSNRRDVGGDAIAELGFSFSAWTGEETVAPASLAITCGAYGSVIRNSLVVSFDPASTPAPGILEMILKAAVTAFDPDQGVVSTSENLVAQDLPPWEAPALLRYERSEGFSPA